MNMRNLALLGVVLFLLIALVMVMNTSSGSREADKLSYSEFWKDVDSGQIRTVEIDADKVSTKMGDKNYVTVVPPYEFDFATKLVAKGVNVTAKGTENSVSLLSMLFSALPFIFIVGLWFFLMRQMQGGGGRAMSFGKSKARLLTERHGRVTFEDVAGVDEAKEELEEIVDFLKDPSKFQRLGGKIPKGALLVGPPGTGKTLIARAVAGEANVPFFTISGSDFVEMFVGVGASRVRDMFEQAKKNAPCIIFIDEIDAVGRHRGAGLGGGHDEREQTLNQLLVEMDGFETNEGVILIAATNRPDVLDPALLRPGRFDRQVVVGRPDFRGREEILKVHVRKVPLAGDVNLPVLARSTPGFSGADLANLVNEAALFAARFNKRLVDQMDFEKAKDKIMMGAERRSMVMSEQEKRNTAVHEAGHTIVGLNVPEHDPVYKVSIIPRGRALGVTFFLPEEDRYSTSRRRLNSRIATLFGGRIAEELIFGADAVTTGASNDIERATELARNMVTKWGLSEKLGPLSYSEDEGEVFLGRSVTQHKSVSDDTAHAIDREVREIVDHNYARAKQILEDNREKLLAMSDALIKYETLESAQILRVMRGEPPGEPEGGPDTPPPAAPTKGAGVAPASTAIPKPAV